MRILIDGTPLLLPGGGVKSYVYNLLVHLRRAAHGRADVRAFPFLNGVGGLTHSRSIARPVSTCARLGLVRLANWFDAPLTDLVCRHTDLFHATNTQVARPPRRTRLTATIHDATCWLMPHMHTRSNVRETRRFFERMRSRAEAWIAVSNNSRNDAAEAARIPAERIEVIHPGVPDEFFEVGPDAIAGVRRKYGLARPYVLDVCVLEPRKNVGALLAAYQRLPRGLRREFDLVVAGPIGWGISRELTIMRGGAPGIRYRGYVPEADLPALTAGAAVFAYPSLYEGFGLPVAQAMAAGVPVLTSNSSALPETTGGAALLVDPENVDDLASALAQLLASEALRCDLAQRGRRRAAEYRWCDSAAKTLDFLMRVQCG